MGKISWADFLCCQIMARRLRKDKSGAVATEYAFLIAFIAIVAALGMVLLGENLRDFFTAIGEALTDMLPKFPVFLAHPNRPI